MATQSTLTAIAFETLAQTLDRRPHPPRDAVESAWMLSLELALADLRDELIDMGVDLSHEEA